MFLNNLILYICYISCTHTYTQHLPKREKNKDESVHIY